MKTTRGKVSSKTRKMALIGIFSAIASVLMFFELPMPFSSF